MDWMATFKRLRHDERGVFAVETAIVAPFLLLMSLGAFQISMLVARQTELQSALADAQAIALASDPDTAAERTVLQNVIMTSTGLPMENVTVQEACDRQLSDWKQAEQFTARRPCQNRWNQSSIQPKKRSFGNKCR